MLPVTNNNNQVNAQDLRGMRGLVSAVIKLAFEDAKEISKVGGVTPEAASARCFLLGEGQAWRSSLQTYCDLADLDPEFIIRMAKKMPWYKDYLSPQPLVKNKKIRRKRDA